MEHRVFIRCGSCTPFRSSKRSARAAPYENTMLHLIDFCNLVPLKRKKNLNLQKRGSVNRDSINRPGRLFNFGPMWVGDNYFPNIFIKQGHFRE